MSDLEADGLTLAYGRGEPVVADLTLAVPDRRITVIVGPNACGKSTLLRGLARLLRPRHGTVLLDGRAIHRQPSRRVAHRLGLLPQAPRTPEGLTVEELVARGRFPHQQLLRQWSPEDEDAVEEALRLTRTDRLRHRLVDELSGGQRQRAWIAMALAQDTPLLLLDEPITFLDLAHQVEVLDLVAGLNEHRGRTIVMVLHDLNQACRYAHNVVAMRAGQIVAQGAPAEVISEPLVAEVFGVACRIIPDPVTGSPLCLPLTGSRTRPQLAS